MRSGRGRQNNRGVTRDRAASRGRDARTINKTFVTGTRINTL